MTDRIKCSSCGSNKLASFFETKPTTGIRKKCCIECLRKQKCPQCDTYMSRTNILRHIRVVHHDVTSAECPHCDYQSSDSSNISRHIKAVHNQIRDHQCTQCDYQCCTIQHLDRHVKIVHDRNKDNECPRCDYKTSLSENLRKHMLVCTGKERMSSGEYAIKGFLETVKVQYEREMRFADCKDTKPLPFDFYLPQYMAAIEFDGVQHFEPIPHWGGHASLEIVQRHDALKDSYCRANNIRLLRIKYTDFDRIPELINGFLELSA